MCNKHRLAEKDFRDWKNKILKVVKDKFYKSNRRKATRTEEPSNNVKTLKHLNKYLKYYHEHFVITSVDKANSNYAFICKKFYILTLLDELGFNLNTLAPIGNNTYIPINESHEDIVERHNKVMANSFNTRCKKDNLKLPRLYWIPKLHKNPYKCRFIAGAKHCTTKQLSIKINKGLTVIRDNFKNYCKTIYNNSGINCFWSIVSSTEFLDKFHSIKAHSVQIFDFSTLYTNLNHDDVISHISNLLDIIFNDTNRKYLCIGFDKSFLAKNKYSGYCAFSKDQFLKAIKFVIQEVFVSFSGKVFRQVRGIPMGGNCSPLLADLFLLHCEYMYMTTLLKHKKFNLARLLSNTSRYIDDLCIINYKNFEALLSDIYPLSLEASRSGTDNKNADYLDIKIQVTNTSAVTSVFHKVDNFKFPVTLLTFPENTMPYNTGIKVFAGQVLRYARICSLEEDFLNKVDNTSSILIARGYRSSELKRSAEKQLHKHKESLSKYGYFSAKQLLDKCPSFLS